MTELERAIEAVKCGLLPVSGEPNRPIQKRELVERMKHCKVPGFSVALIDREEVAWARGHGVREVGCEDPVNPETVFQAALISEAASILAFEVTQAISNETGWKWQADSEEHV